MTNYEAPKATSLEWGGRTHRCEDDGSTLYFDVSAPAFEHWRCPVCGKTYANV